MSDPSDRGCTHGHVLWIRDTEVPSIAHLFGVPDLRECIVTVCPSRKGIRSRREATIAEARKAIAANVTASNQAKVDR